MTLEVGVKELAEAVGADVKALDNGKADKAHTHSIDEVAGLSDRLDSIGSLIGDVEAVLITINGEP